MTLRGPNSTHIRGCWGISSSCCCVRNYPQMQWHKTITALCSQILWVRIQTGPSRNSFSLLHNTWESAGKVCWGLGSTWGCVPDAHIWRLAVDAGRCLGLPCCGLLTLPALPHTMAALGYGLSSWLLRAAKVSVQ